MDGKDLRVLKKLVGQNGEKIVLLDWTGQPPKFRNLLKVAADGRTLWTTIPYHPLEGVWSDVRFEGADLRAQNYAGYSDLIDYDTGRILSRTFVK